jgi:hypothetical protein
MCRETRFLSCPVAGGSVVAFLWFESSRGVGAEQARIFRIFPSNETNLPLDVEWSVVLRTRALTIRRVVRWFDVRSCRLL